MMRPLPFVLLALLAVSTPAAAQSLFSTSGLGVPVAPLDARARALGGIGVGLIGANASLVNPAEATSLFGRGVAAAMQPTARSMEFEGEVADAGGTRFPLIRAVYPFGARLVATAGYGSFLDQSWGVVSEGSMQIGGEPVRTVDVTESSGGIAQLQVGAAYRVTPTLSVGLAGGLYTGSLTRVVRRDFPDSAAVQDFETRVGWSYRGPLAAAGLSWTPAPFMRLGASVTWAGQLEADGDDGSAQDRTFDLPLQAAGGVSALLSPRVMATVGARWAGWSVAADDFDDTDAAPDLARDVWEIGGGLEWRGGRLGDDSFPIRLGFNYGKLPFTMDGETPTEWAGALGFGIHFNETQFGPLASADATLERGSRGSAESTGLTEDFWRVTVSLSLFGQR